MIYGAKKTKLKADSVKNATMLTFLFLECFLPEVS